MISSGEKLRITIDTNCVNASGRQEDMTVIEKYKERGLIEICTTIRMLNEMGEDISKPLTKLQRKAKQYPEIQISNRWGMMRWDEGNYGPLPDDAQIPKPEEIVEVLFPNETWESLTNDSTKKGMLNDVLHLQVHIYSQNDYFVTMDDHFLDKRVLLKERFGVGIYTPSEMREELEARFGAL